MKITVVSMIKNEVDIIQGCCGHFSGLFDNVVIVDHHSTDGTRDYLDQLSRANSKFRVYSLADPGYYQSAVMTWVVKNASQCEQADWIFLLDADEVLPFSTREEFESALSAYESSPVIQMPWKNLVPEEYAPGAVIGRTYFKPKNNAMHHKIAYQPALLPISDYTIAQGNHAVLAGGHGKVLPSKKAFSLYHIPIRSRNQLAFKLIQGTSSYNAMGSDRDKGLGSHWFEIAGVIQKYGITDDLMNGLALKYGESVDVNNIGYSQEELEKAGCERYKLLAAVDAMPEPEKRIGSLESALNTILDMQHGAISGAKNISELDVRLNNNQEILIASKNEIPRYESLDQNASIELSDSQNDMLLKFLAPSTWEIESFTPTSWGGHIPFLFCLITLIKPRVYTELGSHYGASFFAACQALQRNGLDGRAVAVDLWKGDEHAGFYGESVYRDFKNILDNKYSRVGEALRMSFDEASSRFEDQSIDLLHIDGLHTYEAVKNDYQTWLPKVCKNGVIIFHDTNVYERGFGVWKLWEEISADKATYEFKHTHGLGVMALGTEENNPAVKLINLINSSDYLSEYIEVYFSRMGELANLEAEKKIKESASLETSTPVGRIRQKYGYFKSVLRNRVVNFIKSVPFLRKTAYTILRIVRR